MFEVRPLSGQTCTYVLRVESLCEKAGFREVVHRSPTRGVMRQGLRPRRTA